MSPGGHVGCLLVKTLVFGIPKEMSFKDWLRDATKAATKGGKGKEQKEPKSISDLINLGRHEEALEKLERQVKRRPKDHHSRLKLAELKMEVGQRSEAVDEFMRVSEGFERDGFFRKATALMAKVARLMPTDERVQAKVQRLKRMTQLDHLRQVVVDSLPHTQSMKVEQLWTEMVGSELLGRLSEEQLKRLLPNLALRQLAEDEECVSAGARRDELLWIVGGEIAARVLLPNGSQTDIRCFGAGDLIGERALFEQQPWPAVYVATKRTSVLVMDRDALEKSLVGEDDPRGLLEALRAERNDDGVAAAVATMNRSGDE